jgi:hypothetical protein
MSERHGFYIFPFLEMYSRIAVTIITLLLKEENRGRERVQEICHVLEMMYG